MTVSCIVCARYSDFLVENREIFIPHLYLAPLQGVTPPEFRDDFWCMVKLEWLDYCMVKKTMTICVVDSAQRSPRSGSTSLRVSWCYPGDTLQCVYELGRHLTNIASLLANHIWRWNRLCWPHDYRRTSRLADPLNCQADRLRLSTRKDVEENVPSWTTWRDSLENLIGLNVSNVRASCKYCI